MSVPPNAGTRLAQRLGREVDRLEFSTPSHVYNPLRYAWPAHRQYLQRSAPRAAGSCCWV